MKLRNDALQKVLSKQESMTVQVLANKIKMGLNLLDQHNSKPTGSDALQYNERQQNLMTMATDYNDAIYLIDNPEERKLEEYPETI